MKRLQRYFRKTILIPLLLCLGGLSLLALLTQSLSTIDLIVENRQSALTFIYITLLTLPQLIGIILPISVFMATLYALNQLNLNSEMVVAKAAGFSPWSLASPALRVGFYALIVHLLISLFFQPFSQRQMRSALLDVRTDLATQIIRPGSFYSPSEGLTVYAADILPSGVMSDIMIYDNRQPDSPTTYTAQTGKINTNEDSPVLIMNTGTVQYANQDEIRIISFDDYQFDISEVLTLDQTLWLKPSDQYIHELLRDSHNPARQERLNDHLAEGHARLSAPLYNLALVMIAVCFLVRGEFKRMGYGGKIALAAFMGFFIRLLGFALASAAEGDSNLNIYQYALPLVTIAGCAWYMSYKSFSYRSHSDIDGGTNGHSMQTQSITAPAEAIS